MPTSIEVFIAGPGLSNASGGAPGFHWVNKPDGPDGSPRGLSAGPLQSPSFYGIGSGFPLDMPPPVLLTGKQYGRWPLNDFEPASGVFWLLSDAAKTLLQNVDSDAFVFCPVTMQTADTEVHAGKRWLCDVIRFLDAIDEDNSTVRVTDYGNGQRLVQIENPKTTRFRRSRIGSAEIFRSVHNALECYSTAHFKNTVRDSGLSGLGFWPGGILVA